MHVRIFLFSISLAYIYIYIHIYIVYICARMHACIQLRSFSYYTPVLWKRAQNPRASAIFSSCKYIHTYTQGESVILTCMSLSYSRVWVCHTHVYESVILTCMSLSYSRISMRASAIICPRKHMHVSMTNSHASTYMCVWQTHMQGHARKYDKLTCKDMHASMTNSPSATFLCFYTMCIIQYLTLSRMHICLEQPRYRQ